LAPNYVTSLLYIIKVWQSWALQRKRGVSLVSTTDDCMVLVKLPHRVCFSFFICKVSLSGAHVRYSMALLWPLKWRIMYFCKQITETIKWLLFYDIIWKETISSINYVFLSDTFTQEAELKSNFWCLSEHWVMLPMHSQKSNYYQHFLWSSPLLHVTTPASLKKAVFS
jgi:hypothetical protein